MPHADAACNAGRAALLVHALTGRPDLLLERDRGPAAPAAAAAGHAGSLALIDRLRAAGHAAVVSGAGPSVLVLASAARRPDGDSMRRPGARVAALTPPGWTVRPVDVDRTVPA